MKFRYQCVTCGKTIQTDQIIYTCPDCCKTEKKGEFPKGYLKVLLDEQYLKSLSEKQHISIYDFFPYPAVKKNAYPIGVTPVIYPTRINENLGLKNMYCKIDF